MNNFVKSAPRALIQWYETNSFRQESDFLDRLITHPEMDLAWRELSKRNSNENHATRLFMEIVYIERESRSVGQRRSEEQEKFLSIAKHARWLAAAIANGPLDMLVFNFYSAETMNTNGIANWENKCKMERNLLPYNLLREWPPLVKILKSLEKQAIKLGGEAMKQPRIVDRQKENYRQLHFVRALTEYVKFEYGSPLYGTVARISNTVLGTVLTKEKIEKMVRGLPKTT
jgi:hypothetical protein